MGQIPFRLVFSDESRSQLEKLGNDRSQVVVLNAVRKALGFLENNPRHPSLQTHKYDSLIGPSGEEVFEAYAQNKTPGAYRIFFHYVKDERQVVRIISIIPHP